MSISEFDVRHIAALAKTGLAEEQIPLLVAELNSILDHIDALQRMVLPSLEGSSSPRSMVLGDDVVGATALERAREEFAPAMRDGFFLVPRLSTHAAVGNDTTAPQPLASAPEAL